MDLEQAQQYGQHVLMSGFFHAFVVSKLGFVSQFFYVFKTFVQEYHQGVKQCGTRSGWTLRQVCHFVSPDLSPKCLQRYPQTT